VDGCLKSIRSFGAPLSVGQRPKVLAVGSIDIPRSSEDEVFVGRDTVVILYCVEAV
jgi:hypothetical protein